MLNYIYIIIIAIVFVIAVGGLIAVVATKKNGKKLWQERRELVAKNKVRYQLDLRRHNFVKKKEVSIGAYFHSAELIEIFNLSVDYDNKQISLCSFETNPYKATFLKFEKIKNFEIINGVMNTTSESSSIGVASGRLGLAVGTSSTDTYTETTMEKVKLKIETNDIENPMILVMLFNYRVDMSSNVYSMLVDSIEEIKTILSNIVKQNN